MWYKGHPFAFPAIAGVPQSVPGPDENELYSSQGTSLGKTPISELVFHYKFMNTALLPLLSGISRLVAPSSYLVRNWLHARERPRGLVEGGRRRNDRLLETAPTHPFPSCIIMFLAVWWAFVASILELNIMNQRTKGWRPVGGWLKSGSVQGEEDNVLLWMSPPSQTVSFLHYFKFSNGDFCLRKWEWLDNIALQLP